MLTKAFGNMYPWVSVASICGSGILALGILMPTLGTINGYYLEVATQVGIFVALALGLNIVVGLAGLLVITAVSTMLGGTSAQF